MKNILFLLGVLMCLPVASQEKPAYHLFDIRGKKISYGRMIKTLSEADIVLFGELHNNPIAHWLQLEVTKDLYARRSLILGAEMLEADNQQVINDYLQGKIEEKVLDTLARLWPNYKTDYAPLVNFARDHTIPFIATNVPRRYASMVSKGGWESLNQLSEQEKQWIAPLPIPFDSELPTYKNILTMMGDHATPTVVMAQALKDATMAYFILRNFRHGKLFIHFNGAYHSDFQEGILWYLKKQQPGLKYVTISTVLQKDIQRLEKEHLQKADFIICVDEDMTSTY